MQPLSRLKNIRLLPSLFIKSKREIRFTSSAKDVQDDEILLDFLQLRWREYRYGPEDGASGHERVDEQPGTPREHPERKIHDHRRCLL